MRGKTMQDTFNPILSQEDVRGWSLTKQIPAPAPNTVLVLSRSGEELTVINHTDRPISFSKFVFGKYIFLYKVDISEHVLKIDCLLPSKSTGFDFPATVEFTCSVFDPGIIIKANTKDVSSVLKSRLVSEMKQVALDYELQENSMAEKDINRSVKRKVVEERCFDDLGLRISQLTASLQIDSAAVGTIKQVKLIELNEAAQLAEKNANLRLKQVDQEYYEKLLQGGEASLLAAYLTQSPENLASLINRQDRQNQLATSNNMELLKVMLQEDALEGVNLSEAGERVIRRVIGLTESPKAIAEGKSTSQDIPPLQTLDDDDDLVNETPS